ncbi:MAG TPA: ABC transporter permease [Thermoplasmata archaeon]|nr:ABC transporter permease [Thermoplasmata archaeon]
MAIARKNLNSLKHDRRTVGFLVFMPLLLITIFGYTFGGDVKNVRVYVINFDNAPANESLSNAIITFLDSRDTLNILKEFGPGDLASDPVAQGVAEVRDADIWAVIVFSENFTAQAMDVIDNGSLVPAVIQVTADGTNPNIVQAISNELLLAARFVLGTQSITSPISISPQLVYGQDARFIDFFAPGVMGLAAMMVTFMLSIISFVHERSAGTLDRLLATPVTEGEIVAGYSLAFGLVGLAQSLVIITAAILLFDIQIVGSPVIVLLIVLIFGIGNQGLGFMLSSLARNEFQAVQFMPLILFPSILLSGVFWPIEAVPELLRPISYFIPLTYCVDGLRSIMIRGWGLGDVLFPIGILILFAGVMLAISTYGLKKRR